MSSRSLAVIALAVLLAACDTSAGGDPQPADAAPPAAASPSRLEAVDHSDLEWLQENVITPSCAAFRACHKGDANQAGGLNLEAGMFQANVVDVPSDLEPGMDLVEPGSPADSYLMVILGHYGENDPRIDSSVGTMPYNLPILCQEKRDAMARWIESL
jgi:hypothetical protein